MKTRDATGSQIPSIQVEICIPLVTSEQVFLRLAVEMAAKKFREMQAELAHSAAKVSDPAIVDESISNTALHNPLEIWKRLEAVS
jgi:hypothetical protein